MSGVISTATGQTEPKGLQGLTLILVCFYIFLVIERPWESVRYLEGVQIERYYAIILIFTAVVAARLKVVACPLNKYVYGLLALHFLLAPFAYLPAHSTDQGIEYGKMVLLYLLMLSVADSDYSLRTIVKAYVLTMVLYTGHSFLEYLNGRHEWRMGISRMIGADSTYSDPNAFGASLVLSLPFVYALFRTETSAFLKKVYLGYGALVLVCVVLTGSRSAAVALVFLFLCLILIQKGSRRTLALLFTCLVLGTVWGNMPGEKQERIRTIWDKEAGPATARSSAEGRMLGLRAGWEMFRKAPATGIGTGGKNFIQYRVDNLDGIPEQAHNLYAQVLGEMGLGGALLFSFLVASIWRCCNFVKARCVSACTFFSDLSTAIIACILLLLLLGLVGHNFYRPLWLWIAAWAGSMVVIVSRKQFARTPVAGTPGAHT